MEIAIEEGTHNHRRMKEMANNDDDDDNDYDYD